MDGGASASEANSARRLFRTGHNHFSSLLNGIPRDEINASNRHFAPNDGLTGELDFSRRSDSRFDQNSRGSRLSPLINNANFPNSPFAVGSAADFASGARWPSIAAASNITNTEEVNKIRRQLWDSKVEAKPFKVKPKRRLKELEDEEMRGGKFPKLSNEATDDENGLYAGSLSSKGTTLNFASGASWPSIAAASDITNTEEVNKIRRQLWDSKAEAKPFKAKPKRRLKELEDEEMRGGKFPKLSNETTDDENGLYAGSLSSKGTTLNETPVPEGAYHKGPRGMCTVLILLHTFSY